MKLCVCGHDGPTQHRDTGACRVCGCEMFDWAQPRIVLSEYPGGVVCGECSVPFRDGDSFAERIEGEHEALPVAMLVCESCAGVQEQP